MARLGKPVRRDPGEPGQDIRQGASVRYFPLGGTPTSHFTRSEIWTMSNGCKVVSLSGLTGCVPVMRLVEIKKDA